MSSLSQDQESTTDDDSLSSTSQDYSTPPLTQIPILTPEINDITNQEHLLINEIDTIIRRFLMRPNQRFPYLFTFRWLINEEATPHYAVTLTIHEPPD